MRLRFEKGVQGLGVLAAVGHPGDIDVFVVHGQQREVLLARLFAAGRELGHRAARCRLGGLSAGVRVDLGIQYQQVHVLAGSQYVVDAAVADVVRPAVAADDPDTLAAQVLAQGQQAFGAGVIQRLQGCVELRHAFALLVDADLVRFVGVEYGFHQCRIERVTQLVQ